MGKMLLKSQLVFLASLLLIGKSQATDWRGVVPLRSTRADVERLLGKPNSLGRYQFQDERAYVHYPEDSCVGAYRLLGRDNCECLVSRDTVLSVFVTLEVIRSFSSLHLDKAKYKRTPLVIGPPMVTYSNLAEGVIYTVDESDDDIMDIEYLPSDDDCTQTLASSGPKERNSWRGLLPLHSNRTDAERLLGTPASSSDSRYVYQTDNERVTIRYAESDCSTDKDTWNVSPGVVIEILVNPLLPFASAHLRLDPNRFRREESPPLPEKLGKLVNYVDLIDGVVVRARYDGQLEEVMSIAYSPSQKDQDLRCVGGQKR